jgi:site-specific recombinase XerD
MFDKLYKNPKTIARHKNTPFAEELQQFLNERARQGYSMGYLKTSAKALLAAVRRLSAQLKAAPTLKQIRSVLNKWCPPDTTLERRRYRQKAFRLLAQVSTPWAPFLKQLNQPPQPNPFTGLLEDYARWRDQERGHSSLSIQIGTRDLRAFLLWYKRRGRPFSAIRIQDVDAYLTSHNAWCRTTVATHASVLRSFLRYAAGRGWCAASVAPAITGPRIYSHEDIPIGPSWEEVGQLAKHLDTKRPADIRNRAMILLFAVYGLRSSEVTRLRLEDIDWENNRFSIRTSKQHRPVQYPLVPSVGNAIIRYLQMIRPKNTPRREVFLSLFPPYGPISHGGTFDIVSRCMDALGIRPPQRGPHSLRHACATHLLSKHFSLKEIGDLLGHRRVKTTQVYAKVDMPHLHEVAAFDLGGVL